MGLYPGQLCWYTEPRWAWRGPADAHIINAERDECGSVWCCTSPQHRGGNLHLCQLSHIYIQKKERRDFVCFSPQHFLTIWSALSSWRGVTVKCVPPQQPTHIPPLIIISKSRAAYALNIRLLCMVINPITHMDKRRAPCTG